VLILQGHAGPVEQLSFSPDGTMLLSLGWGRWLRLWDLGTRQGRPWPMGQGEPRPEIPVSTAAFIPGGDHLFVTDHDDG
jgi:WD40 repeat protein